MGRMSLSKCLVGSALTLGVAIAFVPPAGAQQPVAAVRTTDQQFKNIQVFKGIPADQLLPAMRFFNASLGVECEFCHVEGDDSKDDKDNKKMARTMIAMEMAIDKDSFNGRTEVTCYTCHRGNNDPVRVPPIVESTKIGPGASMAAAAAPASAPTLPTADAILAKYVDALGGEPALRKTTSRTISGTIDTARRNAEAPPPTHGPFEAYEKAPNQRTMVVHAANGQMTATGFDGNTSWAQGANGVVTEATGTALDRAKRGADFYEPLNLKQEYARLVVRGMDKVNNRDAYVVFGFPQGDTAERLYFDTQTGLLLRKVTLSHNPVGDSAAQTDYLDYRDAGGVKYPSTIRISDPGSNPTYQILHLDKVDYNAPVDAGKLAKPESKPVAPPAAR